MLQRTAGGGAGAGAEARVLSLGP
eukprot:COSAG06_NODE_49846_length_322_cov_1.627803_1_plen_23_part_01